MVQLNPRISPTQYSNNLERLLECGQAITAVRRQILEPMGMFGRYVRAAAKVTGTTDTLLAYSRARLDHRLVVLLASYKHIESIFKGE